MTSPSLASEDRISFPSEISFSETASISDSTFCESKIGMSDIASSPIASSISEAALTAPIDTIISNKTNKKFIFLNIINHLHIKFN